MRQLLTVSEDRIKQEIRTKHPFTGFFRSRWGDTVRFKANLARDISGEIQKGTYAAFDNTRMGLISEINTKKIKLSFIKNLIEYFSNMENIEVLIQDLEQDLLSNLREVNKNLLELNQKIFTFMNYILNENNVSVELKDLVKVYLSKMEEIEKGVNTLNALEGNAAKYIEHINNSLLTEHHLFVERITKARATVARDSEEVLKQRLGTSNPYKPF